MENDFFYSLGEAAEKLVSSKGIIRIISHNDCDGITAAAIKAAVAPAPAETPNLNALSLALCSLIPEAFAIRYAIIVVAPTAPNIAK